MSVGGGTERGCTWHLTPEHGPALGSDSGPDPIPLPSDLGPVFSASLSLSFLISTTEHPWCLPLLQDGSRLS